MSKKFLVFISLLIALGGLAIVASKLLLPEKAELLYIQARLTKGKKVAEIGKYIKGTATELTPDDILDWRSKQAVEPTPPIIKADQILVYSNGPQSVFLYIKSGKVIHIHEART